MICSDIITIRTVYTYKICVIYVVFPKSIFGITIHGHSLKSLKNMGH